MFEGGFAAPGNRLHFAAFGHIRPPTQRASFANVQLTAREIALALHQAGSILLELGRCASEEALSAVKVE
jgi:hypothetical protein